MHTREACVATRPPRPAGIHQEPVRPAARRDLPGWQLAGRAAQDRGGARRRRDRQEWGAGLIRSWNTAGWFDLPARLGDKLAGLIGAGKGEVVITDTTSLNIFKALAAALRIQQQARPGRRVILSSATTSRPTCT